MENRFDVLAKLLASGMSRRDALRQLGGTAAGAVLAALGLGCHDDVVGPQWPTGAPLFKQGSTTYARFCNTVFPPGPERGRCHAAAAHGEGLAVACRGDVSRVCETPTGLMCCDVDHGQICCGTAGCCPQAACCVTGLGVYSCCEPPSYCGDTGECFCPTGFCGTLCCEFDQICCTSLRGTTCCDPGTICGISTEGLPVCLPSPP